MNKHLNSLMDGLTGKVFRTFNVSFTFFCKMGILGRGLGVPPWLSNVWWIWGIVPLLPGTLYGPLQALRDPKKGLNNTHMGCKMLKNAQIIHRSDLNSIEIFFSQPLSPSCGAQKTTFETEDLCETLKEWWDTEEGTQMRYNTLKIDTEEELDTPVWTHKR